MSHVSLSKKLGAEFFGTFWLVLVVVVVLFWQLVFQS